MNVVPFACPDPDWAPPKMWTVVRNGAEHEQSPAPPAQIKLGFAQPGVKSELEPGHRVAVCVGSRGIASLSSVVAATVQELRSHGCEPFVLGAMGSHGSASIEGQLSVLRSLDVSRETVGCEVIASTDTVVAAEMPDGTPIHLLAPAAAADLVVVINRIKPHTSFRGPVESGLTKMLVVGAGGPKGAETFHRIFGMDRFGEVLPIAVQQLHAANVRAVGVGLIESSDHSLAEICVAPGSDFARREPQLLLQAWRHLDQLPFCELDGLVLDRMGKEISGNGFDPNVTGRGNRGTSGFDDLLSLRKLVVLDLSTASHGNAIGVGLADVITARLLEKIDFSATYRNVVTSVNLDGGAIPLVADNDRTALWLLYNTIPGVDALEARVVRARDSGSLRVLQVTDPLVHELDSSWVLEDSATPTDLRFDSFGNL